MKTLIRTIAPQAWRATLLCSALTMGVAGCGGGGAQAERTTGAQGASTDTTTQQALAISEPKLGAPQTLDTGASGEPRDLRLARSATGAVFAVWRAYDGVRHNLWANRYNPATNAWGTAGLIENTNADIVEFDVQADALGGSMAVWREVDLSGYPKQIMAARYNASTQSWPAMSTLVAPSDTPPYLAVDPKGNALVFWGQESSRYYDAQADQWLPPTIISRDNEGSGFHFGVRGTIDAAGNGFGVYTLSRSETRTNVAGNFFNGTTRQWDDPPNPDEIGVLYLVPNGFLSGTNQNYFLSPDNKGNFFVAWEGWIVDETPVTVSLRAASFSTANKSWVPAKNIVAGTPGDNTALQRVIADTSSNALVLWTRREGSRSALESLSVGITDLATTAMQIVDQDLGGNASQADAGFDACGGAIAVWLQEEAVGKGGASRINVGINRYRVNGNQWGKASLLENQPGEARSPRVVVAPDGKAHVAWIQAEGNTYRVKTLRL
ncbi:MAG TPA: hypothetical protein VFS42_09185 [Burkholderiaceae bacterium]|nr:hypothetical protein [Burkholderiaceae bacterium]